MLPTIARLWALLCVVLALQLAAAHHIRLSARQEDGGAVIAAADSEPPPEPKPTTEDSRPPPAPEATDKGSEPPPEPEPTAKATEGSGADTDSKPAKSNDDAPKPTDRDDEKATTTFNSKQSEPTSRPITVDRPPTNTSFYNGMYLCSAGDIRGLWN